MDSSENTKALPAFAEGVTLTNLGDEVLLWTPATQSAHNLSGPGAVVATALAEGTSRDELNSQLVAKFETPEPNEVVEQTLALLGELKAVNETPGAPVTFDRRRFLQAAGAAAAIPLVASVVAPNAVQAASGVCVGACATGVAGNRCTTATGCDRFCVGCWTYSAYILGQQANGRLPENDPCYRVETANKCQLPTGNGYNEQANCSIAYPNAGEDQAWCCIPSPDPQGGLPAMIVRHSEDSPNLAYCVHAPL